MQVWPALKNLPMATERAASAGSASSATITGDLPPSSSVTGTRFSAAARMTWRPTSVDPVKIRWSKGRPVNARPTETSPWHDEHFLGPKRFGQDAGQQGGRGRRQFGWLDHRPVAGGQYVDQRPQGQEDRIVPGGDNADHAERLVFDAIAAGLEVHATVARACGRIQPARCLRAWAAGADRGQDFRHQGLHAGPVAEIGADGGHDGFLVGAYQRLQPFQLGLARRGRGKGRRLEGAALAVQRRLQRQFSVGRRGDRLVHGAPGLLQVVTMLVAQEQGKAAPAPGGTVRPAVLPRRP